MGVAFRHVSVEIERIVRVLLDLHPSNTDGEALERHLVCCRLQPCIS